LSTTGKFFKKVVLKTVQRPVEERGLFTASQFGILACHSMTPQHIRLMDHITLNFNNNIYSAAVFLHTEKAFDKAWHLGLLYKLLKLKFLTRLIKLISCFLSQRKFWSKVKCLSQGIYKQGCYKTPSCPPHFTAYV
jgi:hypothetical protein